jgi:hypothetical protein
VQEGVRCDRTENIYSDGLKELKGAGSNLFKTGKGKGKAIPLQAWRGPEGSRRLRLPDFKTVGT